MHLIDRYTYRNFVKAMVCKVYDTMEYSFHHPFSALKRKSHLSTVQFIEDNCPRAVACRSPKQLVTLALLNLKRPGLILEFGVFKGDSLRYMAKKMPQRELHGFDSFEGLPEAWISNPKGAFDVGGELPKVPGNVNLWKGYFENTLPGWAQAHEQPIAMIHIDCDLNSSTETIFEMLAERIEPGTVLLFDDYFNFPGWEQDGHAVFTQFSERFGWDIDYIGYAYKELALVIA